MKYTTTIAAPVGYKPAGAFWEIAETVGHALHALDKAGGVPSRTIVFGPHLLPPGHVSDSILYNLEQHSSPLLMKTGVLDNFRRHEVWDYSQTNVEQLATRGVSARLVPIGYMPQMTRIEDRLKDIDVLFYGAMNARRELILLKLRGRGLKVRHAINCYGTERDDLIARSKIVLNVHYYDTRIFEIVRCSYLFANRACVVSEESEDVPPELDDSVVAVPYRQLVETCVQLVANDTERQAVAAAGFEAFRQCAETDYLARVCV